MVLLQSGTVDFKVNASLKKDNVRTGRPFLANSEKGTNIIKDLTEIDARYMVGELAEISGSSSVYRILNDQQGVITRSILKTASGEFDLESIHTLSLKHTDISDLGCIGECTSLERLDLSYNSISKLHKLAGLENLQYLNLAANRISSIEGLQSLSGIEKLNLAGNLIGGVDSLRCLTVCDKLVSLRLRDNTNGLSNPVCMNSSYIIDVARMFPNLVSLDGERIKGPGSDVFKMMKEIDQRLAERGSFTDESGDLQATDWVPVDYWDPPRRFEQSMLGDAQQQLEDLLASCKRLSSHADNKLEKLTSNT